MILLAVFFGIGINIMGNSFGKFAVGFAFVFFIAVLAYCVSAQATAKEYGIGYAAWAILFGLIISNTIGTPKWVMPGVQTEYYIKTGLVLLGAEILFGKILSIGVPGIFVAWVVAFCVAVYWVARVDAVKGQKVPVSEIWHRFPKFVLGFIFASIVFSMLYQSFGGDAGYTLIEHGAIRGMSRIFRGWFFCLAFASIGLATNFRELGEYFKGGKPKNPGGSFFDEPPLFLLVEAAYLYRL